MSNSAFFWETEARVHSQLLSKEVRLPPTVCTCSAQQRVPKLHVQGQQACPAEGW